MTTRKHGPPLARTALPSLPLALPHERRPSLLDALVFLLGQSPDWSYPDIRG